MREALFWKRIGTKVVCTLCPHTCVLEEGQTGKCRVRIAKNGKLWSLSYGKVVSMAVDPIEKKPLFHFLPRSKAFSIATPGCNLRCKFCQNWEISQRIVLPDWDVTPEMVVEEAMENGAEVIAYTYTEPTVFYEFALETAKLAKKHGLKNVWISNGYTNPEPLKKIARYLDAANIDVKSSEDWFYREICGGLSAEIPLRTINLLKKRGVWVEATFLVIPTLNDRKEIVEKIAEKLAEISEDIPLHISRFHPAYLLNNLPSTPLEKIEEAAETAKKRLKFVYVGNVPGHTLESTYCPKCGKKVIGRIGFFVTEINLEVTEDGRARCKFCGEEIPGVFSSPTP